MDLLTNTPYTYKEWASRQPISISDASYPEYLVYLKAWYDKRNAVSAANKATLKDEYIQLLKDLSFLFGSAEQNRFLQNIDYTNEDEIIYAIPFFAKKIKDISKVLMAKRESVKNAKLKYNMIGSNKGLETLLYDYVLRSFTQKSGNITQVPASALSSILPELSAVKDDFYIEIEELHDPNIYHDSDPALNINDYQDVASLVGEIPLETLTEAELTNILASRFIPRLANSSISNLFQKYLAEDGINGSSVAGSLVKASQNYLGETIYALTAIRLFETNKSDQVLKIDIKSGNNWFLWPSGNKIVTDSVFSNTFSPIDINSSSFYSCSATAGSDYTSSDLLFTEKNGTVEGAWLLGTKQYNVAGSMDMVVIGGESKEIRFPFCGFKLKTKGSSWDGFSLNEDGLSKFIALDASQRSSILQAYYTETLPNSASEAITVNRSNLVNCNAFAGDFYDSADTIFKRPSSVVIDQLYSESSGGTSEAAFLYNVKKTDLPLLVGVNYVYWPYMTYNDTTTIPITILNDVCVPINLKETSSKSLVGSTAGFGFADSDVIFKLNSITSEPMEAAFLQSTTTDELDLAANAIRVYNTPALRCSKYISGPVQSSLSLKIGPLEKVSFIWDDADTYADDVFKFVSHSSDCPYIQTTKDYYTDQNFVNSKNSTKKNAWTTCTCKSVNFSPIGHNGNTVFDFNGITDMLFHDPDGLGADFALNSWTDTRNLNVHESPQFSFFKITDGDKNVGWGNGYWKTGTGQKMVLKTGKRYTYYRSSIRKDVGSLVASPYLVVKYPYQKIVGICHPNKMDVVIVWDVSKTQTNVFNINKDVVRNLASKLLGTSSETKVAIVAFDNNAMLVGYLSTDYSALNLFISEVNISSRYPDYATNMKGALELAYSILTTKIPADASSSQDFTQLCRSLNAMVVDGGSSVRSLNNPRSDAAKRMLVISDGNDSYSYQNVVDYASYIKDQGVQIYAFDIGEYSIQNNVMEYIASDSVQTYLNLQKYLIYGDGDVNSFVEYITRKLNGCRPINPRWMKAIRGVNGNWSETSDDSDMIINPGDFLSYIHRDIVSYTGEDSYSNFTNSSINFTFNVKLDGWDYNTNTFSLSAIGTDFGAKPFWGKAYTNIDKSNRFSKETNIFGGQLRYIEDYTPVSQPAVSDMILYNGDLVTYTRKSPFPITWTQPLNMVVTETINRWKKLNFSKDVSNLAAILKNGTFDRLVYPTDTDSDILLEGYSQFKPAKYNYFARTDFSYSQDLYYANRDNNSFVTFITGKYIDPIEPYKNLTNVHFPTVAVTQFAKDCVTEKQIGSYLLPEKLGASSYMGRGYTSEITNARITLVDSISAERLYYDLEKYGNRNRGFSKNDQLTISDITSIDNRWITESYYNFGRSGIIKNPQSIQKLVPYQTDYELKGKNYFGLSRQDDVMQLWFPVDPANWVDGVNVLTLRGELPAQVLSDKLETFLINKGVLVQWKSDIFGNDFGVYK